MTEGAVAIKMSGINKFGVCNYDFNAYKSEVKNLVQFETFEEAFDYYMEKLSEYENYPYNVGYDNDLWIVWIEGDRIIQFEQLKENVRCRLVDL